MKLRIEELGTEFINKLGHSLGTVNLHISGEHILSYKFVSRTQLIISTAQVFFHRFYMRESFKTIPT